MLPLFPTSASLFVGQQVFFLGYPYGRVSGSEQITRGIPVPFVKAGILSAMITGDTPFFVLDAHGNPGFSGGPVVFNPSGQPDDLRVAGLVSSRPRVGLPIVDDKGQPILDSTGKPIARVRENTGFVVVIGIKNVMGLIDANPIGSELPAEEGQE